MTKNEEFLNLIPDGWFRKYLDVMVELNNEMPLAFHFLSMAVAMGNALGFSTWCQLAPGVEVYPNVNAILLSPAGKGRRTEGSKLAMKVARMAGRHVFDGKVTPEGLLDELMDSENIAGEGNVIFYVEELSSAMDNRDYMKPLIPLLTKLLLASPRAQSERTRGSGERRTVENPNLSALFTTDPSWFETSIPPEALKGGFGSRFIICYLKDRDVMYVDTQTQVDTGKIFADLALQFIEVVGKFPRGFHALDDEGAKWFREWYLKNETREVEDDRLDAHRNRKPANVLRFALLLSCAAGEDKISLQRLQQALDRDWETTP